MICAYLEIKLLIVYHLFRLLIGKAKYLFGGPVMQVPVFFNKKIGTLSLCFVRLVWLHKCCLCNIAEEM
jgi:hypothetical protein